MLVLHFDAQGCTVCYSKLLLRLELEKLLQERGRMSLHLIENRLREGAATPNSCRVDSGKASDNIWQHLVRHVAKLFSSSLMY